MVSAAAHISQFEAGIASMAAGGQPTNLMIWGVLGAHGAFSFGISIYVYYYVECSFYTV